MTGVQTCALPISNNANTRINTSIAVISTFFRFGGTKLALSAVKEYSALLGISRGLVYSMAPISGVFIILAQIINIYEDVTGNVIEEGGVE